MSRDVPADRVPVLQLPALQVRPGLALRRPAVCRGALAEQRHPVLPVSRPARALPAMLRQAACPAVAWRHPDVRHPGDRQAGARPAPLSARALQASVLRRRAACRGVRPEQQHPVPVLRHLASESAACARLPAQASAACQAAAVLQQAAGAVWDVRALPPAASGASRVQPRAAPAVRVSVPARASQQQGARVRARPKAAALPALRQAARALRALRPAAAVPGARRAVQAVREPGAAPDAVQLPGVASALR
ncbi:hypothetical protein, partial [Bradyrhizobium sp. INPA03-11B]|uniref:hypothetical protein n=1 Tax=Bradyrhizobium sp. INPA03-11B TaxID=418598 RepID=UPI00338EBCA8